MKVIVASKNPVKLNATKIGLQSYFKTFEVLGIGVDSHVSDQPMTNDETLNGALNRARNAYKLHPDASYWVGIEGGLERDGESLMAFAWIVFYNGEKFGKARTTSFELPQKVKELVAEGYELGIANDILFHKKNSKQKAGAVGILTNNVVNRTELYKQAVQLALIPFLHSDLY